MTNFDRYVSKSVPAGINKLDVYNSQNLLKVLDSLNVSLRNNINSGMFEDEMLKELKDIKSLLKVDVLKALQRANDYAPTVTALTDGMSTASPFPKVDKSNINWLTDKRVTDYTTLAYNLSLIKKLWSQTPVAGNGIQSEKPMISGVGSSGEILKSSYDSDSLRDFMKNEHGVGLSEAEKRQKEADVRNKELKDLYKKSASTLLDQFKWMAAPASPYLEIVKHMWDFAQPLRKTAEKELKNLKEAGSYLGRGSIDVINNAWKDAQETRQKNRGLQEISEQPVSGDNTPVEAKSTELQPEVISFPTSISIDNFGDFEEWLEGWLKPMIENGHLTDISISKALSNLVDNSDAHLALLLYISEALDLSVLNKVVYDSGVDKVVKEQGLLPQGVVSLDQDTTRALPLSEVTNVDFEEPVSGGLSPSVPTVFEGASETGAALLDSVGFAGKATDAFQADIYTKEDTPLWSSVSSRFRARDIEDAEYEDITDKTQQQEIERDKQQLAIDSTKAMFDGLRESINDLKEESKEESDQTQGLLEGLTGDKKDSPFMVFLTSLLSGFTSLFSGFASFFSPAMIAGVGALIAYFSSEGFRNFINGVGRGALNKTKDFFDSNKRDTTTEEVGTTAGVVARGALQGSKTLGKATESFEKTSQVAGRAAKIAEVGGRSSTALKAVSATNKAAAALSKLSASGLGKVAGKAGALGVGVEGLNTGLGFLGFDAEANEMNAAKNYDMFKDLDVSGLLVDDAFAKSAGLDNLNWKDYVSSAFNGASLGALAGGGIASAITAALGSGVAVLAMSKEAQQDYRQFAKENPRAFLQMIAAKKAGVSLDRLSFKDAKGKGSDGFVKWLQDNKTEIKEAMEYSSVSKNGLYNTLMGVWYASRSNPNLAIKDLPFSAVTSLVMPTVNAVPIMKKGKVSDIDVSVQPIDLPGRNAFIENVEDALSGDIFRTDSNERAKIVRSLGEIGDDPEGADSYTYRAPVSSGIKLGNGIKKKNLSVNTEGVSDSNIVSFVNGLAGRSAIGDVIINSGVRTPAEQDYIYKKTGRKPSPNSPHLAGRAVDLRISTSLAEFFASKEGYDYLIKNNIDPNFLWAEVDLGGNSHFHVQPRQNNEWNNLFYSKDGWSRYKVYADLRKSKLKKSGGSYKDDRERMLAMSSTDIKAYKASSSGFNSFLGQPNTAGGSPYLYKDTDVLEADPEELDSKSGEWYSGVVSAIEAIGAPFKAPVDYEQQASLEMGDPSFKGEFASGLSFNKLSESKPSKLRTPALNTDLLLIKESKGTSEKEGSGTIISSPSSTQVVTTNNIVNVKSNLYTKQS